MRAHVLAYVLPYGKQYALPFVFAGSVFVRSTKVPRNDWPIDGAYDLAEGDFLWKARQNVSTAHSSFRPN